MQGGRVGEAWLTDYFGWHALSPRRAWFWYREVHHGLRGLRACHPLLFVGGDFLEGFFGGVADGGVLGAAGDAGQRWNGFARVLTKSSRRMDVSDYCSVCIGISNWPFSISKLLE